MIRFTVPMPDDLTARLFPDQDSLVPTVPSVPKQKKPVVGQHLCDSKFFKQNRNSLYGFGLETRLKKGPPATDESPQVFPSVPNTETNRNKTLSNALKNRKNTPKWGVFGAAGQIRIPLSGCFQVFLYIISCQSVWYLQLYL